MALETEQVEVQREIEVMTGLVVKCVRSSANMALDQDEYQKRYSALRALQIGQEPTRAVIAQIAGNTTAGKKSNSSSPT